MTAQAYFDFVAPCKAAGAVQDKLGEWHMPDTPRESYCAAQFIQAHGLEPLRVDPPKSRSFAAIRKAHSTFKPERPRLDKDWQAMRAYQYMIAMRGGETSFQHGRYNHAHDVRFDTAPDGSRRVRYVFTDFDRDWVEVPHWDFVPSFTEETVSEAA